MDKNVNNIICGVHRGDCMIILAIWTNAYPKCKSYENFSCVSLEEDVNIFKGWVKIICYPGRDHRQGGEDFFSKKLGAGGVTFSKNIGAERFFTRQTAG